MSLRTLPCFTPLWAPRELRASLMVNPLCNRRANTFSPLGKHTHTHTVLDMYVQRIHRPRHITRNMLYSCLFSAVSLHFLKVALSFAALPLISQNDCKWKCAIGSWAKYTGHLSDLVKKNADKLLRPINMMLSWSTPFYVISNTILTPCFILPCHQTLQKVIRFLPELHNVIYSIG